MSRILRWETAFAVSGYSTTDSVDDLAKCMASIKEAIEDSIQKISEHACLSKYGKANRDDYLPIIHDMMIHAILPHEVERDLRPVFNAWSAYRAGSNDAIEAASAILAFDVSRIQRRQYSLRCRVLGEAPASWKT